MEKLRLTIRKDEIINALKELSENDQEITLWQNTGYGRIIVPGLVANIVPEDGIFAVMPKVKDQSFAFKGELPLYFRANSNGILFKRDISLNSDKLMICDIPKEIRMVEKRKHSRMFFAPFEGSLIKLAKYSSNSEGPRKYELMLFDISSQGMAFFVGPQNIGQFKRNDLIELMSIDKHTFEKPLDAKIVYSKHQNLKSGKTTKKVLRIGTRFTTPLDPMLLSEIFA